MLGTAACTDWAGWQGGWKGRRGAGGGRMAASQRWTHTQCTQQLEGERKRENYQTHTSESGHMGKLQKRFCRAAGQAWPPRLGFCTRSRCRICTALSPQVSVHCDHSLHSPISQSTAINSKWGIVFYARQQQQCVFIPTSNKYLSWKLPAFI